jgi:hypothetical protein
MSDLKKSIRPEIKTIVSSQGMSSEEKFQNEILRPIIKLQHDLLLAFFNDHVARKKVDIRKLGSSKKTELVESIFANDNRFKTELRGLIIGHFTKEEYAVYQKMPAEINKRIMGIVKERLLSVLL